MSESEIKRKEAQWPAECCGRCKFFQEQKRSVEGLCRRYPQAVGKYPDWWCGEFKFKKGEEPSIYEKAN